MKLGKLILVLTLIVSLVGPQVALAGSGGTQVVSQTNDSETTVDADSKDRRGRASFFSGVDIFWWQYFTFLRYLARWQ